MPVRAAKEHRAYARQIRGAEQLNLTTDDLERHSILRTTGVQGLYERGQSFVRVCAAVEAMISRTARTEGIPELRFPPLMPAEEMIRVKYPLSFPQLTGFVATCVGYDDQRRLQSSLATGEPWEGCVAPGDVALAPAACYPVYARLADTNSVGVWDVCGYCFRSEPSTDPYRMQSFQMHEMVFVGNTAEAAEFRSRWSKLAYDLFHELELSVELCPASDPFFGPARALSWDQHDRELKQEFVLTSCGRHAIASVNNHERHFTDIYHIGLNGELVSSCVAFGLERIALGLFDTHGPICREWPMSVRSVLKVSD